MKLSYDITRNYVNHRILAGWEEINAVGKGVNGRNNKLFY